MRPKTLGILLLIECILISAICAFCAFLESESSLPWILSCIGWLMAGIAVYFYADEHQRHKDTLKDIRNDSIELMQYLEILKALLEMQTNEEGCD